MGAKLDIFSAKKIFESCGYFLQEEEYLNNHSKMKCLCPKGHQALVSLSEIQRRKKKCPDKCICRFTKNLTFEMLIGDIRQKVISKLGRFPSRKEMNEIDFDLGYNLGRAIYKFGHNKVVLATGCKIRRHDIGYWKNWANVEFEIKSKFSNHLSKGICPSYAELVNSGISVDLISKEFNGLSKIAEKLGCRLASLYKCRDGHYAQSVYECMFDEYLYSRQIEHDIHPSIDGRYYADFKINDYFVEIWGYPLNKRGRIHDAYNKKRKAKEQIYKFLSKKIISIECQIFEKAMVNLTYLEFYLDELFLNIGFDTERKFLFNPEVIANAGTFWTEETVKNSIQSIIDEIGFFPTFKELKEFGIASAVRRFGGIKYFRSLMDHR